MHKLRLLKGRTSFYATAPEELLVGKIYADFAHGEVVGHI
jgi:hypothetical protein